MVRWKPMKFLIAVIISLFIFSFLVTPIFATEIITDQKLITVDTGKQMLFAWEGGKVVHQSKVSTGMKFAPTVLGSFKIRRKVPLTDMKGNYPPYPPYKIKDVPNIMYFYGAYAIHGTYWHNSFGRRASHGCVNVPVSSAAWLYNWADIGTRVEVY